MGSSMLKDCSMNPPRRRSSRIRGIGAIYTAENSDNADSSKHEQQLGGICTSRTANHVKVELLDSEESTFSRIPEKNVAPANDTSPSKKSSKEESYYCIDEENPQNISLKDLRAMCRDKKRKTPDAKLIPKEEPDLKEPLIAWKIKRSKCSPTSKIKRKGHAKETFGGYKCVLTEANDSVLLSPHDFKSDSYAQGPNSPRNIKSEALDFLTPVGLEANICSTYIIDLSDNSSGNPVFKGERGEGVCVSSKSCDSIHLTEITMPAANSSDLTPVKSEILDGGILIHVNVNTTSITNKHFPCCLNKYFSDYVEPDGFFYTPEGVLEHMHEAAEAEQLDISSDVHKTVSRVGLNLDSAASAVAPNYVVFRGIESKGTLLEEAISNSSANQLDGSFVCHNDNTEILTPEIGGVTVLERQLYAKTKNVGVVDHSFLCEQGHDGDIDRNFFCDEVRDLADISDFRAQDGHLENIIYEAIANRGQNKIENTASMQTANLSEVLIQGPSMPQLSNNIISAAKVLPPNKRSPHMQTILSSLVGEILNDKTDKTGGDIYRTIVEKGAAEALEIQSQDSRPCEDFEESDNGMLTGAGKPFPKEAEKYQQPSLETENGRSDMEKQQKSDLRSVEENAPRKLLSNRMIISPTSQEKLCKALTDIDLCDGDEISKSKKILFGDRGKMRKPSSVSTIGESQSLLFVERTAQNSKISSMPKGILKSAKVHRKAISSCMKSSSAHMDTEKAIEFSQRQMHDIESITAKLLKSLKSMKSIVDETLSSQADSLASKFTADEIRAASDDASEVERTTRRWLAMMTKDCNRFCKILRSTGKTAAASADVRKDRRKIVFADEAGGMLCHVKAI